MNTPVVLMIFNRAETTAHVLSEIARAKPPKLLVVADGPRPNRPEDIERCAAARAMIDRVDWDCEVLKNYAETNMGCGRRPATGITWAFEQVEEAIILEDDCLPDPSFFPFCEELLEKFRDEKRIMMISGNNFQSGHKRGPYSYYASIWNHTWGWASWQRAWRHYDMTMKLWPALRDGAWLMDLLKNVNAATFYRKVFDCAVDNASGDIDYWDYQWSFACWVQMGLTIIPNNNLVSNVGFGEDATHTTGPADPMGNISRTPIKFPLNHPSELFRDELADRFFTEWHFMRETDGRYDIFNNLSISNIRTWMLRRWSSTLR